MKRTRLRVLAFFLSAVVLSFPLEITAQARDTATGETAEAACISTSGEIARRKAQPYSNIPKGIICL